LSAETSPLRATADADDPAITRATLSLPLFSVAIGESATFRLAETNLQARPLDVQLQVYDEKGQLIVRQDGHVGPNQPVYLTFTPRATSIVRGAAQLALGPGSVSDPRLVRDRLNSLALSEEIFRPKAGTVIGSGPIGGRGDVVVTDDGPQPPSGPVRIYAVGPYAPSTE